MLPSRPLRRRLVSRLARLVVALGAVPLLAPTCGESGEGFKTFARSSIIIPMDVCYQRQTDGTGVSYAPAACPQAADDGDVIRAYGLVYQLIRNDIAVYWVIDNAKTAINGVDLTVQYAGGFPVLFYDWSPENPPPASPPTTQHAIDYRGGPFVVDGSDYARASQVLQGFRTTFQNVNVHVSNVAFRAYAKRTMAGGWSAGGTVAPKVALLDIGSTSNVSGGYAKNSEPIIRGYLARAGLDFAGAGGLATDGGHGQIYDRLGMADLQPSTPGDWTTTNLARYQYQILWVPHWFAPGSCADPSTQARCVASLYPAAQREQALATVGAFVGAGKDLFAECAGLGSFEGVASGASGWSTSYEDGHASTHFHATNGLAINKNVAAADYDELSASSPLLQLGDYPFIPRTGAIQNFKPATGRSPASTYTPDVKRLVTDLSDSTWDYFTYRPPATGRGTTVYLGGHVYSGYADTLTSTGALQVDASSFAVGGTRLVLNTLFNLGAACTASGVACNTGQPGICAQGTIQCQGTPAVPTCVQTTQPAAEEICNGLDDDCDWEVDEDLQEGCYDLGLGHPTLTSGLCRAGISSCVQNPDGSWGMSSCVGQVLPAAEEICNALDDNCDGTADEGLTQPCYEGPSSSIDPSTGQPRPVCQAGTQACALGSWGACQGQVLPQPEFCTPEGGGTAVDEDCDGTADEACTCLAGQTRPCYSGPAGTAGVGICRAGTQTCTGGAWGTCAGEVLPGEENCATAEDENCDTLTPPCPECTNGATGACYPGDPAEYTRPNTQCAQGTQTCAADHWGDCVGFIGPADVEACDALDNDCDGTVDDGAVCPTHFTCLAGVCVPDACGVEIPPPEGYACNPPATQGGTGDPDGTLVLGACGADLDGCATGVVCEYGQCVPPCAPDQCAAGSICGGGACIAGGCYATGCPSDDLAVFPQCFGVECLCREGICVADPCNGQLCPSGTFCRAGDCVQACTFVSCSAGQKCGLDGFCEEDPCAGRTCPPGERCADGLCAANPCAGRGCAEGQVCGVDLAGEPVCLDDPCAGITCPAGVCTGGQCFATSNPTGGGTPSAPASGGCGCGSGGAPALPVFLALAFVLAPLARRRRRPGAGGLALLLAAVALVSTGCPEEDPFDPGTCQETCGEQRCVDLASDAANCQTCGVACSAEQQCVDRACGPTSAVAPYVTSLSPTSGPPGSAAPVQVRISGERFVPGAKARLTSDTSAQEFATAFLDAGTLTVDLDLSAAAEGTFQLRVVNPDRVISNAKAFLVTIPYPTVTGISPPSVVAGSGEEVLVSGSGFVAASQCRIGSVTVAEVALPSTVDAAGVHCTIDPALPPGAYGLRVVNPGARGSTPPTTFNITSGTATVTEVSPSAGPELTPVTLTVTGDGFDPTSQVLFDGCAGPSDPPVAPCVPPAAPPIVGTTFVSPTTLVAALVLPDCTEGDGVCDHLVSVRNGAGVPTAAVGFVVQADAPTVTLFATNPAPPYQGDASVQLTFTGTNFPAGSEIQVQPPGGAFGSVPVTMGTVSANIVAGTISLAGRPEGSYFARIDLGGAGLSSAWPFRVLSNQAILRDMTADPDPDRSGPQGTTKTLTLEATNLRPPYGAIRVLMRGPGIPAATPLELDPTDPAASTANLVLAGFSLVGREAGNYALTVRNPGGAVESNALSFAVTPGQPTVTSVCRLEGTSCAATNPASAVQQTAPVPVRITGTNFAKPDASGNGSTVMVSSSFMPGWPTACPAPPTPAPFQPVPGTVEVVSSTEIVVQLDTLSAIAVTGGTTYYVAVWNPGGPQKSDLCQNLPGTRPPFTVLP